MLGKKGMSPLVVTILLIAFAVALGTMIMNWSSGVASASDFKCEDMLLEVQKAFDKEILCFLPTEDKIRISIKNRGSFPLDFLVYRRITSDLKSRDLKMPDSNLGPGKVYEADIPFQKSDKIHIEFIPGIMKGGQESLCPDQAIVRTTIPDC